MEVERKLKISQANISACARNKRKTAGGYIWRYEREMENNGEFI